METMINTLSAQAQILMEDPKVLELLEGCATHEDKCRMLFAASIHALAKQAAINAMTK